MILLSFDKITVSLIMSSKSLQNLSRSNFCPPSEVDTSHSNVQFPSCVKLYVPIPCNDSHPCYLLNLYTSFRTKLGCLPFVKFLMISMDGEKCPSSTLATAAFCSHDCLSHLTMGSCRVGITCLCIPSILDLDILDSSYR